MISLILIRSMLSLQTTISPTIFNEFRFQWGRDFEYEFTPPPLPGEPTASSTGLAATSPDIFLTNGLEFGNPTFLERPKYPDERRYQFADSFTYIAGRHSFKFGGDLNRVSDDIANLRYEAGAYSYNNINDFIIDYTGYKVGLARNDRLCDRHAVRRQMLHQQLSSKASDRRVSSSTLGHQPICPG